MLILDSSLLIADEREDFNLAAWLRGRAPEPVAMSASPFLNSGLESRPKIMRPVPDGDAGWRRANASPARWFFQLSYSELIQSHYYGESQETFLGA